MNCQLENINIYNIISCFKTLKVGKKKKQLLFLLEKGAKKKNRGFKSKNIYHRKRKGENSNTNPELLRSYNFSV